MFWIKTIYTLQSPVGRMTDDTTYFSRKFHQTIKYSINFETKEEEKNKRISIINKHHNNFIEIWMIIRGMYNNSF